jgi:peptidoglycan/LPS O-acetylase OafA/YrhL
MQLSKTNFTDRGSNSFDVLRLLLAVMVIVTHSFDLTCHAEEEWLYRLTDGQLVFSYIGVRGFFVISGLLVAQSLFASSSWKSYLLKRCLRIFPALIVVILLSAFVLGPLITALPVSEYFSVPMLYDYLRNIYLYDYRKALPGVFESNPYSFSVNGSLWTLRYEFTMYLGLLAAYALGVFRRWPLLIWLFALLFASRLLFYLWPRFSGAVLPYANLVLSDTLDLAIYFAAGVMLFYYKDRMRYTPLIFFAVLTAWLASFFTSHAMLFTYLCLPYLVIYAGLGSWGKSLHPFGKGNDISYGMYIYAFPVQQFIIWYTGGETGIVWLMILSVIITMPFAVASWFLVERPALRLKARFSAYPQGTARGKREAGD